MAITRFDDIDNLVSYFSATPTESNIVKSGDVITSVDSAYGADANQLTQLTATSNNILHDGTTKIGEALAFVAADAAGDYGLTCTLINSISPAGGITMACLEQRPSTAGSYSMMTNNASNGVRSGIRNLSNNYGARLMGNNVTLTPAIPISTDPTTLVLRHDTTANSLSVFVNGVECTATHGSQSNLVIEKFSIHNESTGGTNQEGRNNIALAVLYNRRLNDVECADLIGLMEYWRDNAATQPPPTSATFGPVTTNHDVSVTGYQWEESSDGNSWANIGTLLDNTIGATTDTLTVVTAPVSRDQTRVRCRAFSDKHPAGVVSHSAILTVQAP